MTGLSGPYILKQTPVGYVVTSNGSVNLPNIILHGSTTVFDQFVAGLNSAYSQDPDLQNELATYYNKGADLSIAFSSGDVIYNGKTYASAYFTGFTTYDGEGSGGDGAFSPLPGNGANVLVDFNLDSLYDSTGASFYLPDLAQALAHELGHPLYGNHVWGSGRPSDVTQVLQDKVSVLGIDAFGDAGGLYQIGNSTSYAITPDGFQNKYGISASVGDHYTKTLTDGSTILLNVVDPDSFESIGAQQAYDQYLVQPTVGELGLGAISPEPGYAEPGQVPSDAISTAAVDYDDTPEVLYQVIGSSIGQYLAGGSVAKGILYSTLLSSVGQQLSATINSGGENIEELIGPDAEDYLDYLGRNVGDELAQNATGTFSSLLFTELGQEAGLSGFSAQALGIVGSTVVSQVVSNVLSGGAANAWAGFDFSDLFGSGNIGDLEDANISTFLGAKLAALVYSPTTEAGQIGASIGADVGALAGGALAAGELSIAGLAGDLGLTAGITATDTALAVALPGVGALVGFILGALIGDLFGSKPKIPTASAQTVLAIPAAEYELGAQTSANGGDLDLPVQEAALARDTLNGIIQQITLNNPNAVVSNLSSPTQVYGYDGSGSYVQLGGTNATKQYVSTTDQAVDAGVLWALPQTQVIGGDLFLKRAVNNSAATDVTTLLGDIQVASDYEFYVNNRALINSEITAAYATLTSAQETFYDNHKALVDQVDSQGVASLSSDQMQVYDTYAATIGAIIPALQAQSVANPWIVTLQRASELGLDEFAKSDFYGGLKGLLDSFPLAQEGIGYEDISLTPDYNAPGWVIVSLPQTVGAGVFSSLITSSPDGSSFEIDPGGFAQGGFTQEPGVSGNGGDYINSYSVATPVTLSETVGNNILVGSQGNDHLTASSGYDWLDGYSGNDVLVAKTGDAVLLGGDGNDHITVGKVPSPGTYYLSGGAGNDTLTAEGGVATFVGGTGKDTLNGGSGKNTFIVDPGLAGGSTITGGSGTNTLSFERVQTGLDLDLNYDDLTNPSPSAQQVSSDTFSIYGDTISNLQNITGGSGNDFIVNTAGMSSVIIGGAGDDDLNGWGGNDTLEGGSGADNLNGWSGINTLSYESSSAGVYINLATGEAYGGDADGDTIQNFSNVTGSNYNDTLAGNDLVNTLSGGGGDDTFLRSAGGDSYSGGDGFDTVDYSSLDTSGITANLETGVGGGLAAGDTYSSIEKIIGTGSNDVVTASSTGSTFEGAGGSDTFNGGDGSDTYILGRGDGTMTVNDNNKASNTIQIGPGLGFDDLFWGTSGGPGGVLKIKIRGTISDELLIQGNFVGAPSNDVAKTLNLDGLSPVDISRIGYAPAATDNDDTLDGYASQFNALIGYGGNDTLLAAPAGVTNQNGNVFDGDTGDDRIFSSTGDDQFLFEKGDGIDTITDAGGTNTLVFGSTVSPSDVLIQSVGYNLFIGIKDPNNPLDAASAVPDHVVIIDGAQETKTFNQSLSTYSYSYDPTINTVEVGGTTINVVPQIVWKIINKTVGHPGAPAQAISPVVLDLQNDGLEISSVATSDIGSVDAGGVLARMSWVGPTNGILVTDRDGSGLYNTTDDISFIQDKAGATSDLQGLQGWDTNGDGQLDAQDDGWGKLQVWIDANQDGVVEAGEVQTLAQAGVTAISLNETASGFDPSTTSDSYYTGTTDFTRTDGTTGTAYDVTLARTYLTQATQTDIDATAAAPPDATIGQLDDQTAASGSKTSPGATLAAVGKSGARSPAAESLTLNTTGGVISAQDAALWASVLKPGAAAPPMFESTADAAKQAILQATSPYPAGYDEWTGRANEAAPSRGAELIVFDLTGAGLVSIDPTKSHVAFDAAHTGSSQTTGWVGPNNAILTFDANGDGKVDPATEITFKPDVATARTSLGALASFDTNKNGYLDAGDADYASFLLWRDANGNGVSDPGETETLAQAGVAKLALTPTVVTPDSGDLSSNVVLAQAQVVLTDGTTRTAYDVGLGVKGASTQAGATPDPTPTRSTSPRTSTPQTPEIQPTARAAPTSSSLTAQGAPSSSAGASPETSLARAAEDGPQTPQGAQWASAEDTGEVTGWWNTSSIPSFSPASLSAFRLGGQTTDASTSAPSTSVTPDAATQQRQLLLRQSLASFKAPASNASAVWTRQPAADLSPSLAAAASKPLPARTAAIGGVAG